ncbi:MAG: DUF924 family protein [Pseudomonadota bacterium]
MRELIEPNDVLDFWASLGNDGWWTRNEEVDQQIHDRFGKTHEEACKHNLNHWAETADGALALIIVLDQFSRNMFRGDAKSFAQDAKALEIAETAISKGLDKDCREDLRVFFYLPYEHAESIAEQEISVQLQHSIRNSEESMKAALEHREIIQRFGRFPHRNPVMGRHTTPAEQAFLDGGGFKG